MDNNVIDRVIKRLEKQVRDLEVPYLDEMVRNSTRDPFRVLISCLLSLRTQDRTTAVATESLFGIAPDVEAMNSLSEDKISETIYPVGFYKVKAVRIKEICRVLIESYGSRVPDEIDELIKLKGVGRKTANLVVTLGYEKPGICVDTHVHRITNRWGYVKTKTPDKTELALRDKLPKKYWIRINGLLVAFGQGICKPISPICSGCTIASYCEKTGVTTHR